MERLVRVAKDLRLVHKFNGYIHLKSIPGASQDLVNEAGLYADRLSVNIEIPNEHSLQRLAPEKDFQSVFKPMQYIQQGVLENLEERKKYRYAPRFAPAGQSTQMIVGATADTDKDILNLSSSLYDRPSMKRVYYSGYISVNEYDKRLPALKQPPLVRENRLYQADWLLRFYQFKVDEIVNDAYPDLDLEIDPKLSWSVKAGDVINEDDILFEVSTAKVSAEIPSPVAGKILQILFKEGDTVSVGTVVAIVQLEGDSEEETPEVGESTTAKEEAPASSAEPVKNVKSEEARWYSPIVLQIAQEAQLSKEELDSIPGTGYEGRLSKKDIKTYVEQRKKGAQPAALAAPQKTVSAEPALVSPQKVASAEPAFVAPSKPVTVSQPVAAESKPAPTTPVIPVSDGDEVVEMDFVRRIIADHMPK